MGLLAIAATAIYMFSGMRAIVHLVAFVYPTWASLKAINKSDKEENRVWLAYWIFYLFFTGVESITDILLFWIPFYEFFKMCFYVYLYRMKGALVLYENLLKPVVSKLEVTEQKVSENIRGNFQDMTTAACNTRTAVEKEN